MMNDTVWATLNGLKAGELQSNGTMTVLPLFDPTARKLGYVTLSRALASGMLRVTEVSASGSVPELDAENRGDQPVLLFDGEEVAGAKQNRVFNTSILVPAHSKIRIPVSCTERGRWSYRSDHFAPSGNVMAAKMRAKKAAYVSASLEASRSYAGNQGAVWRDVSELHTSFGSSSPTDAMSDAFHRRMPDIDGLAKSFKPEPNQAGMVVAVDGRLLGFDYLSSPGAFSEVFPKLIRSYAVEGLAGRRRMEEMRTRRYEQDPETGHMVDREVNVPISEPDGPSRRSTSDGEVSLLEQLRNLLLDADSSTESLHKSVGMGKDYRYKSDALVGSALVAEGEAVHVALLAADEF